MLEGNSSEEPVPAGSRKNSILVKTENSANRQNLQSAHPHFVEQILPHRSPPGSVSGPSDSINAAVSQLQTPPPASQQDGHQNYAQPSVQSSFNPQTGLSGTKIGPSNPRDQLDQFHLSSAMAKTDGLHSRPDGSSGGTNPSSGKSNFGQSGDIPPSLVPSGALLAQAQADAQNSVPPSGPSWARQSPHLPHTMGPPSHPSRVGSPSVPSDAEGSAPLVGRATSKQPSDPRIPMDDGKIHILLGVTGSLHISSVKSIITKLLSIYGDRVAIQVIVTPAAEKMVASSASGKEPKEPKDPKENKEGKVDAKSEYHAQLNQQQPQNQQKDGASSSVPHPNLRDKEPHPNLRIWHDADEWDTWRGRNDPVVHIELRRWADILIIAPLSANTLGKIAMGLCDNLLTNVVRAWNAQYPILIAPAMVAYAYNHPATKHHLKIIREEMKWIEILRPTEKVAGSTGGIGMGGMMPWNEIVDRVVHKLGGYPDDDDEDEDDDDDDDIPRGRSASRNLNDDEDDDVDDDDEEEEDDDILKEGIDGSHQGTPHGSPI